MTKRFDGIELNFENSTGYTLESKNIEFFYVSDIKHNYRFGRYGFNEVTSCESFSIGFSTQSEVLLRQLKDNNLCAISLYFYNFDKGFVDGERIEVPWGESHINDCVNGAMELTIDDKNNVKISIKE